MAPARARRLSYPGPNWVPKRTEEQDDLPPSRSFALLASGTIFGDVISVPTMLERPLIRHLVILGDLECAVIKHDASRRLHFFAYLGAARQWRVPGTQGMAAGTRLAIPFADMLSPVPSPYWLRPPRREWMVNPDVLEVAICRARQEMRR